MLPLAAVREHVETDLVDAALQRLIDDAAAQIVTAAGSAATQTDTVRDPLARVVTLTRSAAAITSVHERTHDTERALAAGDWRLTNECELVRQMTGPNPRAWWGDEVRVVYMPMVDAATRQRVLIDLVRLAVQYQALESSSDGSLSQVHRDYAAERRALLSALRRPRALA